MQRMQASELSIENGEPPVAAPTRLEVYEARSRRPMIVLSLHALFMASRLSFGSLPHRDGSR